ncbi:MAG: histidine phosphatase family protein [Ruminococcus sp.]|nr:histidine phosphatase family protein [Ruminococcus sp.]
MVELYLIRHAEAMGNVNEVFQGTIDEEISPKGLKQLDELKERFIDIKLDKIYTSPLIRAVKTARMVNYYHGLDLIRNPDIAEINGGDFEGKKWSDLPNLYPEQYYNWKHNQEDFQAPNGETMKDVYNRMVSAMNKIIEENLNLNCDTTIAVVSHGCAIRNYQCYLNHSEISYMPNLKWSDNTAVSKIVFSSLTDWKVEYLNDSSHLSEENSTLKFSKWCKGEV